MSNNGVFVNLCWIVLLPWLKTISAETTEDPFTDTTTDSYEYLTEPLIVNATDVPDNGMAIRDIGQETSIRLPYTLDRENGYVEGSSTAPIVFPDNHKNYSQQYEGELPPRLDILNRYQEQYRAYNEQKDRYNSKPVKFEEDSHKNYFAPQSVDHSVKNADTKVEPSEFLLKPFPYPFELSVPTENWYPTHGLGHLEPKPVAGIGHQESFPYYQVPHESGHDHKTGTDHSSVENIIKHKSSWKKVAQLVTALVPLGLLLASLTPTVLTIDSAAGNNGIKTSRQRSADQSKWKLGEEDVLRLLQNYGIDSTALSECEDRIICELAKKGHNSTANSVEKGFWYLANKTPTDVAEKAGMTDLFRTIKTGRCESYRCDRIDGTKPGKKMTIKKIIKRRKIPK